MAKFILCEVASYNGRPIKMEDIHIVAINVDCIEALHQDIIKVDMGEGCIKDRIGMEVCSTSLKNEADGRLIIMMDYKQFFNQVNNENT